MKLSDKANHIILTLGAIALVFVALIWWKNRQNAANSNTAAANQTLDNTAGMTSAPILPQFQYGQQNPFQVNLSDYTAQIPQFHYSGNQSIYMPMFGFVGYGAQPL